ncbi:MAG: hypothetical protein ACK559_40915, partial [bacterium]
VAVGLLHHEPRHLEEGVGAAAELDLPGQRADAAGLRRERELDRDQRLGPEVGTARSTARSFPAGRPLRIPGNARGTATLRAGSAIATRARSTIAARTGATEAPGTGSAIAAAPTRPAEPAARTRR